MTPIAAGLERIRDTDPGDHDAVVATFVDVVSLAQTLEMPDAEPLLVALAELAIGAFVELGREPLVAGLARHLWSLGAAELSLAMLERAESVAEAVDDAAPTLLINLRGEQLRLVGDLDGAEVCFQRVLAVPDGDPEARAAVLNNLGNVYREKGDPARAKTVLADSVELAVAAGVSPLGLAVTLDNLGVAELALADRAGPLWIDDGAGTDVVDITAASHLEEAEEHFARARELFETELPDAAGDYVLCLLNSAQVAWRRRHIERLGELSERALDLARAHPLDADTQWLVIDMRGRYLLDSGRAGEAVELMEGYERLWPRVTLHERLSWGLTTLLRAALAAGREDVAEAAARTIAGVDDQLLDGLLVRAGSDAEARHQYRGFVRRTELLLGIGRPGGPVDDWLVELVFNRKGVLAERQGAAWLRGLGAADLAGEVRRLRAAAARLDLDGTGSDAIRHARRRHEEALRALGDAEARLHRAVAGDRTPVPRVTLDDVRAALDEDTVLLEFTVAERPDGARHHIVFLVRATGPVRYRDLGPVATLADPLPPLFTADDQLPRRIVIAPTGTWGLVPFARLPAPDGRPLIDEHLVYLVPAARWIVLAGSGRPRPDAAGPPLVIGDADFDLDYGDEIAFFLRRHHERLPYTAAEARDCAARLGVEPVLGRAATRQRLLAADSPRVLHIASHGVFVNAIGSPAERREPRSYTVRNVGGATVTEEDDGGPLGWPVASRRPPPGDDGRELHERRVQWLEKIGPADPLSRSVLLLAGVNAWLAGVETPDGIGNGMVTAGELALADLAGTDLVVLSACQSGTGAVDYTDGSLLGLRTAALRAGAACCVSTLWRVRDDVAAALMAAFYRRLASGDRPGTALRTAQLEIRATHPDPQHWAGWIAEGIV
jgi:tetratricopeptide (TPR) repeat protein